MHTHSIFTKPNSILHWTTGCAARRRAPSGARRRAAADGSGTAAAHADLVRGALAGLRPVPRPEGGTGRRGPVEH